MKVSDLQTFDYFLKRFSNSQRVLKLVSSIDGSLFFGDSFKKFNGSYIELSEIDSFGKFYFFSLTLDSPRKYGYSIDQIVEVYNLISYEKIKTNYINSNFNSDMLFELILNLILKTKSENVLPKYLYNPKNIDSTSINLDFLALDDSMALYPVSTISLESSQN